jgi:hypothetical protein
MADSKLSELTTATGASSSNLLYVVQNGQSKKISASSLAASLLSGNLSNTSNANLLLGSTPLGGSKSFELTIDYSNDFTGIYADTSVLQLYTSSYVQLITNSVGSSYIWNFNKDGTATWPVPAYVPTFTTSTGSTGQVSWTSSHVYVCVATNTWRRASLGTW